MNILSQWRAALHSFQGNSQRVVLHSCQFSQLVVVAIAFVCAWWLHAEFVSFDYAVSASFVLFLTIHFGNSAPK
jgi:hypothetical protein